MSCYEKRKLIRLGKNYFSLFTNTGDFNILNINNHNIQGRNNKLKLIPVKYNNLGYPNRINPQIQEVAGHFDVSKLYLQFPRYSLHTEYCYCERSMNS